MKYPVPLALGIVVGNVNSSCAHWKEGRPVDVLINARGKRLTPSAAFYRSMADNQPPVLYIGEDAIIKESQYPGGLISDLQKYVGLHPQEVDLEAIAAENPGIVADKTNTRLLFKTRIGNKEGEIQVEKLTTLLVESYISSKYLGEHPVGGFVLAMPIYYTQQQRQAVIRSVSASLRTQSGVADDPFLHAIAEPLCAVIGSKIKLSSSEVVVVVDVGGSSTLVSLVEISQKGNSETNISVIAVEGSASIGSQIINKQMTNEITEQYEQEAKEKITHKQLKVISKHVENLKRDGHGDAYLELFANDELEYSVSKLKMAELAKPVTDVISESIKRAVEVAGIELDEIASAIAVGGGVKLAPIRESIQKAIPGCDLIQATDIPSDELLCIGAGRVAEMLSNKESKLEVVFDTFTSMTLVSKDHEMFGVVPAAMTAISMYQHKSVHPIALKLHGGESDVVIPADTLLPHSVVRSYCCPYQKAEILLIEIRVKEDQRSEVTIGTTNIIIPQHAERFKKDGSNPNVALRVSVTAKGGVEVCAIDTLSDESVVMNVSEFRRFHTRGGGKKPPSQSAEPEEAHPADESLLDEETAHLLDNLRDHNDAILWFLQQPALVSMYEIPAIHMEPIQVALNVVKQVTEDPDLPKNSNLLTSTMNRLAIACDFPIGPKKQRFLEVSYGTWVFAVAPQTDDVELLKGAFHLKIDPAHIIDNVGNTLLHEIAQHEATNCFFYVAQACRLSTLLHIKNKEGKTALDVNAAWFESQLRAT
eukprot:TRINITY_DN14078_c0_g1_i1.p1 TRINITY_DN14078_c0_g1~~TRINITY_DN14078_c0_g1_i1.p1  ORF type:complete len:762 (+),score=157.30 TRINITY_DN14078_c0_g1_i1:35-2320(+)